MNNLQSLEYSWYRKRTSLQGADGMRRNPGSALYLGTWTRSFLPLWLRITPLSSFTELVYAEDHYETTVFFIFFLLFFSNDSFFFRFKKGIANISKSFCLFSPILNIGKNRREQIFRPILKKLKTTA